MKENDSLNMTREWSEFCDSFTQKYSHVLEYPAMDVWLDLVSVFGFIQAGLPLGNMSRSCPIKDYEKEKI